VRLINFRIIIINIGRFYCWYGNTLGDASFPFQGVDAYCSECTRWSCIKVTVYKLIFVCSL